jgi:F-type H+-transporting ATPase subunit b
LTSGLALVPHRASAQSSAPAASSPAAPAATQSANTAKPEAQSEQDEVNSFRHAPIVQSIGKMLHLDVETTAKIFEGINFAIIFLVIAIPLGKMLPKMIRKRSQTLQHDIQSAREATADAKTRLSAVEVKLAGLDEEIQKIRLQVEHESLEDEVRVKAAMKEESARIVSSAEQELTAAATQVKRGLRAFAANLAVEQAEKQLALTPETDSALIAEFIGQIASDGASYGVQKNQGGQH